MADIQRARRDAEKAARAALGGTLVDTAGDLGAAVAAQADAADAVTAARAKAAALLEAAQAEGAALIATAHRDVSAAEHVYATAWTAGRQAGWTAGRQAGWTPAQLRAMGYPKPSITRRLAPPASTDADADATVSTPQHRPEPNTGHVERVA